ncbi:hypothetical protein GBL_2466 [Geobacillus kaustophilus GBlys]|uniref:Uncharacterized protein n=1 Tax=Geobacillus kaustophilus GBlys TaxID=1337888 RepID=U2Y4N9_GEOKU|nr:hypothetical protein GBL_2466 [Geobacillus kaustophilus GBlys]
MPSLLFAVDAVISFYVTAKSKKSNALGGHDYGSCFRSRRVNNQIIAALFFARVDKLMFAGGVVIKRVPFTKDVRVMKTPLLSLSAEDSFGMVAKTSSRFSPKGCEM